jgi:hypothetical protein
VAMKINNEDWSVFDVIRGFFPLRLLITHVKHNLISLFFWLILFLIVSDGLGSAFGLSYLFLSPEYLGEVSGISFLFSGFALGGFIMGFNTFSYLKIGAYYPFFTTISKPFVKFCINNAVIPIAFIVFYLVKMGSFQMFEEYRGFGDVVIYSLSFLGGISLFLVFSIFYLFPILRRNKLMAEQIDEPISSRIHKNEKWYDIFKTQRDRTYIYIGKRMRFAVSRSTKHFDQELVERVYAKNRVSSSLYEILTITIFFVLGLLSNYSFFEVPAAASIILLITICLMIFSALYSWLKVWIYPLVLVVLTGMNYLSVQTNMFKFSSFAYGLDYSKKDDYSIERILKLSEVKGDESYNDYIKTLENWKKNTGEKKPKLVVINVSGGGSRSAMWAMTIMDNVDRVMDNKLSKHTQMITGASGGMVGASYYREILLRKHKGEFKSKENVDFVKDMGKDMLNKLAFMASTNDIFIRYRKFNYAGQNYVIDRGYGFEEQLNENTNSVLDHSLGYYKSYEQNGIIPTMIFSPTIVNDGRRFLISSQSLRFLTNNSTSEFNSCENIDFHDLLSKQNSNKVRFTSVMRASASFPFVMPMISLPTNPSVQLMDAGIRDNYGGKTTMEFLYTMKDWITENTSGVIIVQIRDVKKVRDDEVYKQISFMDKFTLPFGNIYKNFPRVQDFNQDELLKLSKDAFDFPVDKVSFNLLEKKLDRISLSWHLTRQEREKVQKAFFSKENQQSLRMLEGLLE